jgi:hypothetical protein
MTILSVTFLLYNNFPAKLHIIRQKANPGAALNFPQANDNGVKSAEA